MSRYDLFHRAVDHAATLTKDLPIVNVNLITFKADGANGATAAAAAPLPTSSSDATSLRTRPLSSAQESFLHYWVALTQMIDEVGGRVIFAAEVESVLGSAAPIHGWQCVAFVFYPSIEHYRRVIERDQFLQIKHLRRAAVDKSVLYTSIAVDPEHAADALAAFERAELQPTSTLDITTDQHFAERHGYHLKGVAQLVGDAGYTPWRFFRIRRLGEPPNPRDDQHHSVSFSLRSLATLRQGRAKL